MNIFNMFQKQVPSFFLSKTVNYQMKQTKKSSIFFFHIQYINIVQWLTSAQLKVCIFNIKFKFNYQMHSFNNNFWTKSKFSQKKEKKTNVERCKDRKMNFVFG